MGPADWFFIGLLTGWLLYPLSIVVQKIFSNAWIEYKKDQKE